jgi:LmbE family N-acetylglucosaminyl deacetylase
MINLFPSFPVDRPKHILLVGAHSDDIEIGCGATLLRLCRELRPLKIHWLVLSAIGGRADEARASAEDFLKDVDACSVEIFDHRDGHFPAQFSAIKQRFEDLKPQFSPDLIFTHHREDRHQDHRIVSELTWNTFRNHLILEYEVPKFDGGLGDPNVFVPLTKGLCDEKVSLLTKHFHSQKTKQWFDATLFNGLMRLRGLEGATPDGYAEAFHCRKWTLAWRGA